MNIRPNEKIVEGYYIVIGNSVLDGSVIYKSLFSTIDEVKEFKENITQHRGVGDIKFLTYKVKEVEYAE